MKKDIDKKRKQDLGIFYTRPEVVDFIFDILSIWKNKEDKKTYRWQSHSPPHNPSLIDPACGEGVFLKRAVENKFTKPDWIFGIDLDEKVVGQWEKISLLETFGENRERMTAHLFHQNGLDKIHWEQHKKLFYKKLKKTDIEKEQFDCVVGNPPYGGVGLGELSPELEKSLYNFPIWKLAFRKSSNALADQLGIFGNSIKSDEKNKLSKIAIEILFVDRFIQLAKPGGWLAIIIPDGILTNSNSHYVREFICKRTKVEAIISLPRETFKSAGTNAKTSIIFLKKLRINKKPKKLYPVFMASVKKINYELFNEIIINYEKFYNLREKHMNNSDFSKIIPDQTGREAVMIRIDKTLKELMNEKPASRWDPDYWHPIFENNLVNTKYLISNLGEYITFTTYGQVGRREFVKKGIPYLSARTFTFTGIDRSLRPVFINEGEYNDPPRSRVIKNDWLLVGVGVGSVGKSVVVDIDDYKKFGQFGQDVKLVRFSKNSINPYYVEIYMKTKYGSNEVARYTSGVSGVVNIDFDEIKAIKIPVIPQEVQTQIENICKKIYAFHNEAMILKEGSKDYLGKLTISENMLKDLIKKTEEVIESKREDVT